ncbi:Sugar phosphatase YidA [compost metagenome]
MLRDKCSFADWEREMKRLYGGKMEITTAAKRTLDITATGITKGSALAKLIAESGHNHSRTMAFGNEENDISLFQVVAYGIAVADANEALLKQASFVTASAEEDGVGVWVERFFN